MVNFITELEKEYCTNSLDGAKSEATQLYLYVRLKTQANSSLDVDFHPELVIISLLNTFSYIRKMTL